MNIVLKNAENDEYKQDEKHEDDETDEIDDNFLIKNK